MNYRKIITIQIFLLYEVLQENPGIDFTKVSKELARLWGCLNIEEKENYKKMANENKKIVLTTKKNDTQSSIKSFQFILKNLKRYSTLINVELSEIKKNIFENPKEV